MFTWAKLILAVLSLVGSIVTLFQRNRLIDEGEQKAIARAMAELLAKNLVAKKIMEDVYAMDEVQVDTLLRELERD